MTTMIIAVAQLAACIASGVCAGIYAGDSSLGLAVFFAVYAVMPTTDLSK